MDEISYKNIIFNFLKDERYYSLLISGKWGVGKTYLWKEIENEIQNNSNTQSFWKSFRKDFYFTAHCKLIATYLFKLLSFLCKYMCNNFPKQLETNVIYISLFGKESYREVLEEVVLKAYDRNKLLYLFRNLTLWKISLGTFLTLFIKKDFKNKIVCFDDIERKTENFKIKDFLGLVYKLKEEKCKVIVISNIDEFSNDKENEKRKDKKSEKDIFGEYKEKTFDLDFEVKTKEEVINQILEEKLGREYEEHYKQLIPKNIYRIENLRKLNKIIEAFKFFNKELDFKDKLKEKKDFRDLFTYVFEMVVEKIKDDKKSRNNYVLAAKTEQESIFKQSGGIINNMIESYLKNSTFHISLPTKEKFEEEMKEYHFYILIKKFRAEFDIVLRNKDYCNERKNKVEAIINEIKEKGYTKKLVGRLCNGGYTIFDFFTMVKVLSLDNDIIEKIKEDCCTSRQFYLNSELKEIVYGSDEEFKERGEKILTEWQTNPNQPPKPSYEELILKKIYNYESFRDHLGVMNDENKIYNDEEIKKFIKENKIISQYLNFALVDKFLKFKREYPRLYEILCSLNQKDS